jgi:hypothetical protein
MNHNEKESCQIIKISTIAHQSNYSHQDVFGFSFMLGRNILFDSIKNDCMKCKYVNECVVADVIMPRDRTAINDSDKP